MKSSNWRDIAELIGIAGIVASLVFVGLQMQLAQKIAVNDEDLAVSSSIVEINNAVSHHADIWIRGASGSELSESEALIFKNLIHNSNISAFFNYLRMRRMGNIEEAQYEIHDFAAMLHQNPGARKVWLETEEFFEEYRLQLTDGDNVYSFWKVELKSSLEKLDRIRN